VHGKRVAERLIKATTNFAKETGAKEFHLLWEMLRTRLYEKMGFIKTLIIL
jgi:hypothetical protein